ncbi:T6SS immunity protein Tli3 family protein, partial [Rahnella selenatireducens]
VMIIAVVIFVIWILWNIVVSMIPTLGGSFGAGFPSGSGGRAIRDVEIDVEPQVVYRIDDHRFFTLEQYLDCNNGGFVYYNDTNKKIKVLAGYEGADKRPQNEVTINEENNVMAFKGKFIYAASDNIIAYPYRDVDYKYGNPTYFAIYDNIKAPSKRTGSGSIRSDAKIIITDEAMYIKDSTIDKYNKKIEIPKINSDGYEWIESSKVNFKRVSKDDHFHCDNTIKPRRVKYISN